MTKHHLSVHLEFCRTNRGSTELSCMCFCSQTSANKCVQCEMQENRGTKRGYCQIGWWWCHCLRCCVSWLCWVPAHDPLLTEWSRLHGYPINNSLVQCAKGLDLKPTENFWADIKRNLSRNTPENILNEIPTKSFLQLVQSMPSRIQDCLHTSGRYSRNNVVIRNIIMQCCYKRSCC